jgi:hypothetical protein
MKESTQKGPSINLTKLKNAPRLSMTIGPADFPLATSEHGFLYCPHKHLTLINTIGQELFTVKRSFGILDICWSSCLNKFFILSTANTLHSLDVDTRQLTRVIEFSRANIRSCTCYSETLMVSNYDHKSFIDVYSLGSDCQLTESYELPILGRKNQYVEIIRLSATYLGVMLNQHDIERNWFELRRPDDMSVLHSIDLLYNEYVHRIIVLPNNEFLIHAHGGEELFVLAKNAPLAAPIKPNAAQSKIVSTAYISNQKCFMIQISEPRGLHFYDL